MMKEAKNEKKIKKKMLKNIQLIIINFAIKCNS